MKRQFSIWTASMMLVLSALSARATDVSGPVAGLWTLSGSPYNVVGEINLSASQSLSIEPGVQVIFQGHYKFIINTDATLLAVGTAQDSIRFTAANTATGWFGLRFLNAASACSLAYCVFEYGKASGTYEDGKGGAIYLNGTSLTISHCRFSYCQAQGYGAGLYCGNNSSPLVSDNHFIQNNSYYKGGAIACDRSNPVLQTNTLSANTAEYGAGIACDSSFADISGNLIHANTGAGIYCADSTGAMIDNNTLSYNSGSGIYCLDSRPQITNNLILANANTGIYCSGSSPNITGNTINLNYGWLGGGISCLETSNPIIVNNTFLADSAGYGGAIYIYTCHPTIQDCQFDSCKASLHGGAIYASWLAFPVITGSSFTNNRGVGSSSQGGAVHLASSANATVTNNEFINNSVVGANTAGGGLYVSNSIPLVHQNTFTGNTGGGLYFGGCDNAIVTENSFTQNLGAAIYCYGSYPHIENNTIFDNPGTGIYCKNTSDPVILNNTITGNNGGGIYCYSSWPTITNNVISNNAYWIGAGGGAIYCYMSSPTISYNLMSNNESGCGGAIYCASNSNAVFNKNTIVGNTAPLGGAIYVTNACTPQFTNCIIWGNSAPAIYLFWADIQLTYCDLQELWPGLGNLSADPLFVDPNNGNYHLSWVNFPVPDSTKSPCIDTGNPNPSFNDPDFTLADLGCYFFDQGMGNPVTLTLTPQNPPIQIPSSGGSFNFIITIGNTSFAAQALQIWCNVTLPSGMIFGPVIGPVNVTLGSGMTISRLRTQAVPGAAPAGSYSYNGFTVNFGDTLTDSFPFTKLGSTAGDWRQGWFNDELPFDALTCGEAFAEAEPTQFQLDAAYPNPFNSSTIISYQFQTAIHVNLRVYDTSGRLVQTLVDGWREEGRHSLTFDGSTIASGIYLVVLEAGGNRFVDRLLLVK